MIKDPKDTIVALATPPGIGAIAVIRLSGENAIDICDQHLSGKDLSEQDTHTIHFGSIKDKDDLIDEVLVNLFKNPRSYTGEDVIEVSCHGSPYIQERIIKLFINSGARMAEPGEFTLRAFLNGKFDLAQAEAVADLIASNTESSHELAIKQMRGAFSNQIKKLREEFIHFASMIELELDFSEEDVEFANRDELQQLITNIQTLITTLISSFELGNVIKNGVPVTIAGKPNVGKSTLLNALVQDDRAIVSEIPGTTRDVIEEHINIDGVLFRFIDTAGIRKTSDQIEKMGVEKAMDHIGKSAITIYLFDVENETSESVRNEIQDLKINQDNLLCVGNKTDKVNGIDLEKKFQDLDNLLLISAKEKNNMEGLTKALTHHINHDPLKQDRVIVTNVRHYEALENTRKSLDEVLKSLTKNKTGELLAQDIKTALHHLGTITGEVTTEDLLEVIFSRFCIGK